MLNTLKIMPMMNSRKDRMFPTFVVLMTLASAKAMPIMDAEYKKNVRYMTWKSVFTNTWRSVMIPATTTRQVDSKVRMVYSTILLSQYALSMSPMARIPAIIPLSFSATI